MVIDDGLPKQMAARALLVRIESVCGQELSAQWSSIGEQTVLRCVWTDGVRTSQVEEAITRALEGPYSQSLAGVAVVAHRSLSPRVRTELLIAGWVASPEILDALTAQYHREHTDPVRWRRQRLVRIPEAVDAASMLVTGCGSSEPPPPRLPTRAAALAQIVAGCSPEAMGDPLRLPEALRVAQACLTQG